nr:adenylate/guanylate cyclase domain-containing protein [Muriicola soli]
MGDTVNVAARMERMSEGGKITISDSTYQLIRGEFDCEYRGEFEVRNKGTMKLYYVSGKRKENRPAVLSGMERDEYKG